MMDDDMLMLANRRKIKPVSINRIETPMIELLQLCKSTLDKISRSGVDITDNEFKNLFVVNLERLVKNCKNDGVL